MLNFDNKNPLRIIPQNDSISLQTEYVKITYKELIEKFEDISNILKKYNIDENHRVLLIQKDNDILKSYIVFLSCIWHGCSPAYFRTNIGKEDPLLKYRLEIFKPTALIFVDNLEIEIIKNTDIRTKLSTTEAFCNFTHGPKADKPYNCNILHWIKNHNHQYGHNVQSIVEIAHKLVDSKKINQLTNMQLSIPYSTDVLLRSILTGGTLSIFTKIDVENTPIISKKLLEESRINYVCGFKKTYLDLFSNIQEPIEIDACEFGGGVLDADVFREIFAKLKPKKLIYHFSSFFFGYTFIKYLDGNSNIDSLNLWNLNECLYLEDKDIDFSEDGELLIRLKPGKVWDFESLGDRFDIENNVARFKERSNQDYFPRLSTGGKIYIHEIEQAILSLQEVTSVKIFQREDVEYISKGYHHYGMIYSGNIGPNNLSKKLKSILRSNQIPKSIFNFERNLIESIDRSKIIKLILSKY